MARKSSDEKATDAAAAEVQEKVDEETEQGFRGVKVDPTPNENYTLAGVASGAPTPETDPEAAETARKSAQEADRLAEGVARNDANPKQ
jgi:hypothetical protein